MTAATHAGPAPRRSSSSKARRATNDRALIECIDRTLELLHYARTRYGEEL